MLLDVLICTQIAIDLIFAIVNALLFIVSLNWQISLTANLEETDMNLMLSRLCEQSAAAAAWAVGSVAVVLGVEIRRAPRR